MSFGNIDDFNAGGSYFKPKDHGDAACIVMEPVGFRPNAPGYQGKIRDALDANIWVFSTPTSLEAGEPSKTYVNAEVESAVLVRRGKAILDSAVSAVPFTLKKEVTKSGNSAWVTVSPDPAACENAGKFWASVEADRASLNDLLN